MNDLNLGPWTPPPTYPSPPLTPADMDDLDARLATQPEATITNSRLAEAYLAYGNRHGFLIAEVVLGLYVPDHILDGKCYDVLAERRPELLALFESFEIPERVREAFGMDEGTDAD